jgi:hypothetical protein
MRARVWILSLSVALIATAAGVISVAPVSADEGFTVWEHSVSVTLTPPGPPAPGHTLLVQNNIFRDEAQTDKIGVATIVCTITSAQASLCQAVDDFTDRGQIMVQVLSLHPRDTDGAIVGGTGEFAKAGGEIHVRNIQGPNERVTFDLD